MKRTLSFFLWLMMLAGLVVLAAGQSRRLAEVRRERLPEAYTGAASEVPPAITFVMAGLGGFRGVVAEVLWFRANRLQDAGRYLELVQLADWLTMLDPHASEAWVYNAWNLAYNVSVMMGRPEDRLRWVSNGITLLRDDGLRFNPRDARLYRELAWFYQNKVGDSLDQAHLTYKLDLARQLAPCVNADGTLHDTPENRVRLSALRLDADRMVALERRFGPLDWRLPNSHAIYWAAQGLEFATGHERLMCRRAVYQPLILSVFNGRLTGDINARQWRTAPNFDLALPTAEFLLDTYRDHPSATMKGVVQRFLSHAIHDLYRDGRTDAARSLYTQLTVLPSESGRQPSFEDVINNLGENHD
ncbi:MAG TPA: hypothetical protein P5026_13010 [Kiritimatiellia bacterium]|nr:hypothetical protein [Kiritimatiellia bacterium]HRU71119.1 hypothetical protein [Kiritimatiellia bacterium]